MLAVNWYSVSLDIGWLNWSYGTRKTVSEPELRWTVGWDGVLIRIVSAEDSMATIIRRSIIATVPRFS